MHVNQHPLAAALLTCLLPDIIDDVRTLGERLRHVYDRRQAADMAAGRKPIDGADVNEAIGKKRGSGYFSRLVNGKRATPDPSDLMAIAKFFGVSFEWLQFGRGLLVTDRKQGSSEEELLRITLEGRAPLDPRVTFDAIDAAIHFAPRGTVSAEVIQEHRDALAEAGVDVASRQPGEHLLELMSRQARKLKAAALEQARLAEATRVVAEASDEPETRTG